MSRCLLTDYLSNGEDSRYLDVCLGSAGHTEAKVKWNIHFGFRVALQICKRVPKVYQLVLTHSLRVVFYPVCKQLHIGFKLNKFGGDRGEVICLRVLIHRVSCHQVVNQITILLSDVA